MSFSNPALLLLLLPALGLTIWLGWPRRRYRRARDTASLLLRGLILLLLVLALAGLQIVQTVERLAIVFLVDHSDSVSAEMRAGQMAALRSAIAERAPDDAWALIVFGANVSLERGFELLNDVPEIRSRVVGSQTNLANAIQTAIAIFPPDARRRIVILSDGQQTAGDAEAKARLAAASGIEISYIPFEPVALPDLRLAELNTPQRVSEGQEFDLRISIEAEEASEATLLIFSSGQLIQETPLTLTAGMNRYTLRQQAGAGGFLNYSARIVPAGEDRFPQNNQLAAFTEIVGAPRVLVLAAQPQEAEALINALLSAGMRPELRRPADLPPDTAALADYRAVLLVNTPVTALSAQQLARLDSYVRDLGGGLVVIGGPQAYGPGEYLDTTLEAMLPLRMDIEDQQRLPQLTIAYLIDRSGSMGAPDPNGIPNIELAKRAIDLSLEYLQPGDRVAVGTFDTGGAWVAEFQPVGDRRALQRLIATLRPGGGTDILAGLNLVARDIVNEPSPRKHILLMTDGGANPRGLVQLVQRLREEQDVTTSVIAIGTYLPDFLEEMARVGEGNYHIVSDLTQLPRVFALETVLASRTFIQEGIFSASRSASHPILDGLTALPRFYGYVATTAKQTAQVILSAPEPYNDPLLAVWQLGLGRVAAFTSDATGRWAREWLSWSDFPRFWAQVTGWSITEQSSDALELRVERDGELGLILVEARNEQGDFLNGLELAASILGPDNQGRTLALEQVAPGRYETRFTPSQEGAYFVAVRDSAAAARLSQLSGWVLSYSPEYIQGGSDERLLANLAAITGGQNLGAEPGAAFAPVDDARQAATPIWQPLLLLALLLLPFDIALRRLVITASDLRRLRAWMRGRRSIAEEAAPVSSLRSARDRVRERQRQEQPSDATLEALRQRQPRRSDLAASKRPLPPSSPPIKTAPPEPSSSETVSALLRRKRDSSSSSPTDAP